ncbi:unnamed protein product, partial [Rotaria sp. Silwood1]
WNAAATQIFFSLGPGFGVLLALSSYNKFHNNCYRDALLTSTINCATSVLAGFVIFSTLGHMAAVSKKSIDEVIEEKGSELVFIVYPHTIALGQYHRAGVFTIWQHICPLVKGIGWATVLINFMTATFYNTVISWAFYYLVMSFNGLRTELPWKSCDHTWNTKCCVPADIRLYKNSSEQMFLAEKKLNITTIQSSNSCIRFVYSTEEYFYRRLQEVDKADGFNNLGKVKWELALSLLVVFILVYFALWKGIKSSGKAVWITAIAPYAVLFILLIRGVTLPGASLGIHYYLRPKMELLKSFEIWNAAATQIFFSLGPGFGVLLALSSYNKFHNNCYR